MGRRRLTSLPLLFFFYFSLFFLLLVECFCWLFLFSREREVSFGASERLKRPVSSSSFDECPTGRRCLIELLERRARFPE